MPDSGNELLNRIISLDCGPYAFGLRATAMLGVRDFGQVQRLSHADSSGLIERVRCVDGVLPAIELHRRLSVSTTSSRHPLVLTRLSDAPNGGATTHASHLLGLFVDSTSRPQSIAKRDWHVLPDWVRAGAQVPADAIAIQHGRDGKPDVRLILDPKGFVAEPFRMQKPETAAVTVSEANTAGSENRHSGRGLLVFAPGESSRTQLRIALAIPMSFVLGVDLLQPRILLPSHDPHLDGIAIWNGCPIPVLRLGDALGLTSDNTDHRSESTRLVVVRTPQNRLFGFIAHAQMRSLRTPKTAGNLGKCGIEPRFLHGAFVTDEGPLAIPNLDRLIHSDRWT
ncbi:MAG: chemotaxis protein CheW [Planctomycetota bacterium]